MPPTVQQIKDSLKAAMYFYRQSIQKWMQPAAQGTPIAEADPVDYGYSVVTHNTGAALYGILVRPGGEVGKGSWQSTGPGGVGYYPIKLAGPMQFLFLNRREHCSYSVSTDEWTDGNGVSHREEEIMTFFTDPEAGDTVAVYEFRRKVSWDGTQTNPKYEYWVKRVAHYDPNFKGVGWSTYELVDLTSDGQEKQVCDATSNPDPVLAGASSPLAEYPIKLHNSVRLLFEEMAQYYQSSDSSLSSDLQSKADRIKAWVDYWRNDYGIMKQDFLDMLWPPATKEEYAAKYSPDWLSSAEAFYEVEFWPVRWSALALSPYKSHLVTPLGRGTYLGLWYSLYPIWPSSPYFLTLKFVDNLHRGGSPSAEAFLWCQVVIWDGKGVDFRPNYPLPTFIIDRFLKINVAPDVYKGDAFGGYFCGLMFLYKYATDLGHAEMADWAKARAGEVADIALQLQIPWDGKQYDPDGNAIYIPNEAGGFMGAYKVDEQGNYRMGSWAPWEMNAVTAVLDLLPSWAPGAWDPPNFPWPGAGSQAFETTLMCTKALKMYKELVLNDYT